MKHVSNRDVFPADSTVELYRPIDCLLSNPVIDAAFLRHEAAAVKAKKLYHNLGRFAIIAIAASSIYTVAEALVIPPDFNSAYFSLAAVLFAGIGIALQVFLVATHQKEKWLLNRFAVERLRSSKFQIFALAQTAPDSASLKTASEAFAKQEVAALENELNIGNSILKQFRPAGAVRIAASPRKPVNTVLADLARNAFIELRVKYQRGFAERELATYGEARRILYSSQDIIYLCAAGFALLALASKLFVGFDLLMPSGWLDFLAVSLFIIGATGAILDNASIQEQSQSRFEQYVRDISDILASAEKTPLPELVERMEQVSLDELDTFCRAGDRISYRL